eukprot:TRINITY_DN4709_c0_g1_i1.p1 TRINITY_DN4709_c0_g1~~TRINITY_DN4709_c0_g1_i1.p1  ORF type:complete len:976 (-),score=198.18 TRINITY_DN4709_c0_g1_i1:45-2972(-)
MHLVVVVLCFFFSAYALEDIYDVDIDKLPAIHHKDFRTTLLRPDKRRAVLADESFFLLYGIGSNKGVEHAFVIKPAMQNALQVVKNGEPFEATVPPVFHGYSSEDPATIIAFSFSGLDDGNLTPLGMAHFASGDHYTLHHDEKDGFFLVEVNATTPRDHIPAPCDVLDLVSDEELAKSGMKKRGVEEVENVHDNAIGSPPILQVEVVIQSDVAFSQKFPNGAQQATDYIRTVLAAINVIYERDLRATLVWQYFGFNTANAPANNLNELNNWLIANPQIEKLADVAVVFNGVIAGGLGYLGSVCGPQQTAHLGIAGSWGTNAWDANNDVVVTSHEIGHVLGSPHTHDPTGYNPVIDKCGSNPDDSSVIPWDGGSVMSYCHIVNGGNGWKSMSLYMGAVGRFGYQSERVNTRIRATMEKAQCLSSTDPSWAPFCSDTSNYVNGDGSAVRCSEVAANGDCSKGWGAAPNCMRSCGRCVTSTNSVWGNLPIYASNTPSPTPPTPAPTPTPTPAPTPRPSYNPPSSSSCDDVANPSITRNGSPITCQNEALLGKCSEWYNQAPNCKASCGWSGCKPPCDDIPNPAATVTNENGILSTCAQQAQAGFCPYGWMNSRTCRASCNKCTGGDIQLTEEGGQNTLPKKPEEGKWTVAWNNVTDVVDTRDMLFDQGASCTLNKGIPSTKFIETSSASRAVDDFIVPAGKTWSVREVKVMGSWFVGPDNVPLLDDKDSGKSIDFYVTIFHSRTIQCKSIVSLPLPLSQVVVIDIAASHCLLLGAHDVNGTLVSADEQYYITISPLLDVGTQFLWSFSKTQNGASFKWRDAKNIYGTSECKSWTDGSKCGMEVAGSDLCFAILGTSAPITSQDAISMNNRQTTNGGDGEIGSDSREFTHAWNPEDAARESAAATVVQENSKQIFQRLSSEEENVLSIQEAASVNGDGDYPEHPWLIPVVVVACVVGLAVTIGVVLFIKTRVPSRLEVV